MGRGKMPHKKQVLELTAFNPKATLPYSLRLKDFDIAMQDVYDFFYDVNAMLLGKGLHRMDDMLRPAAMSGMISDMLMASMAKHARVLVRGGKLGTRTSTLSGVGIKKLRSNWIYLPK